MFYKCKTSEEAKKLFRRLVHHLHPDKGGESDLMVLLQEAYKIHLEGIESLEDMKEHQEKEQKKTEQEYPGEYQAQYEDVKDGDLCLKIIDEILLYAKNHKKFNTAYTNSLVEFLEENKFITSSQYNGLVRIYYSFRMHEKKEEKPC